MRQLATRAAARCFCSSFSSCKISQIVSYSRGCKYAMHRLHDTQSGTSDSCLGVWVVWIVVIMVFRFVYCVFTLWVIVGIARDSSSSRVLRLPHRSAHANSMKSRETVWDCSVSYYNKIIKIWTTYNWASLSEINANNLIIIIINTVIV